MAVHRTANEGERKRRSKKRKARLEVSSSSESDSDVETTKEAKRASPVEETVRAASPAKETKSVKKEKKKSKAAPEGDEDAIMMDAPVASSVKPKSVSKAEEEFSAVYLRKITTELADDLDKVREAQDFKASSVPMLIHALKQGESLFTGEEKRRVVGGTES
ncbi:ribosome-assembly protein 3-domain-containing protein [Pyrenochaeta sp. MPI-SDFR-AT-0127]|nr:ribosome-assembly protein 3-domain-containing protein [Pyrenochaeta sp. MPI-SDFR-AT-0127]